MKKFDITLSGGFQNAKTRSDHQKKESDDTWYYLGLVGQIGFVIALPIAGGAILGSLVQKTLLGLGIGFVISVAGFIRTIQKIMRKPK